MPDKRLNGPFEEWALIQIVNKVISTLAFSQVLFNTPVMASQDKKVFDKYLKFLTYKVGDTWGYKVVLCVYSSVSLSLANYNRENLLP